MLTVGSIFLIHSKEECCVLNAYGGISRKQELKHPFGVNFCTKYRTFVIML